MLLFWALVAVAAAIVEMTFRPFDINDHRC
jgi:hypothetical protein